MEESGEKNSQNDNEDNEGPAERVNENRENDENDINNNINNNENDNDNGNKRLFDAKEPFSYFESTSGNSEIFSINNIKIQNEDYKYCMCILMEDDSLDSSNKLNTTLTGISLNLKSLEDNLEIIPQNICLFIFVKSILNNKLFDDSEKGNLDEGNKNFIIKDKTISYESSLRNVKMYVIANANGLYEMRSLRCYYSILKEISKDKYMIFSSIITAGVMPVQDSLLSLIKIAYNNNKSHGIAIAPIEYTPVNIYSNIALYEKIHFNIFNMSLYDQSCSPPISSLFCTMFINNNLLNILNEFYRTIPQNATIDYHDYNLSLHLSREEKFKYEIIFNYEKAFGMIKNDNMEFFDYQKEWIERHSGYYGNFFDILGAFIDFKNFNFLKKLFMLFQIVAIIIEFILPSLSCMVIYTVFYECFNTYDYRIALFFTLLYLCMMFVSGVCSLITKNPKSMSMTNYFIYFFMIFFYALVLVCSIPAMHFAKIDKLPDNSDYNFNKAAISLLIILNFIFYIIPFLMKISAIIPNIVPMLMYLVLGATCSTTNFNVSKIWNAPETSGGKSIAEKKSLCILIYLCFNIFFGSLSFYNVDRKKRANCVMGFGIFFLIYNFFRMLAVVFKIIKGKPNESKTINDEIKKDLVKPGNEEDLQSEQKKLKNIDDNNNEDKNDYENNEEQNDEEQNNEEQNNEEQNNEEQNNEEQNNEEQNNDEQNNDEQNNSYNENSVYIREVDVNQNE